MRWLFLVHHLSAFQEIIHDRSRICFERMIPRIQSDLRVVGFLVRVFNAGELFDLADAGLA